MKRTWYGYSIYPAFQLLTKPALALGDCSSLRHRLRACSLRTFHLPSQRSPTRQVQKARCNHCFCTPFTVKPPLPLFQHVQYSNPSRIITAIVFRLHYLQIELSSTDPTLKGSLTTICTQIQISYAIIAATTPCLRPFVSALSTNYGSPAQPWSASNTKKSGTSYTLSSFSRNRLEKAKQPNTPRKTSDTRWDSNDHHVEVVTGDTISFDSHSSVQMIIQRDTEWDIAFEGQSFSQRFDVSPETTRPAP